MDHETRILQHAEVTLEFGALCQSLLDGDLQEARFRVLLVVSKANSAGMDRIAWTAGHVLDLLGGGTVLPTPGYGQAIDDLSFALEQARPSA